MFNLIWSSLYIVQLTKIDCLLTRIIVQLTKYNCDLLTTIAIQLTKYCCLFTTNAVQLTKYNCRCIVYLLTKIGDELTRYMNYYTKRDWNA